MASSTQLSRRAASSPDEQDPGPSRDLLALAREDLVSAEALDKEGRVWDSPVGFHAQRAVDKALKAAIASRNLEFPFTHDLGLLMTCHRVGGGRDFPTRWQTRSRP